MTFLKFYQDVITVLETLTEIKMPPVTWHWDSDIPEDMEGEYTSPNGPTWHWSMVWDAWLKTDSFRSLTDKEISLFSWSRQFGPGEWDLERLPTFVRSMCVEAELPPGQAPYQNGAIAAQAMKAVLADCIKDEDGRGGLLQDRLKSELEFRDAMFQSVDREAQMGWAAAIYEIYFV